LALFDTEALLPQAVDVMDLTAWVHQQTQIHFLGRDFEAAHDVSRGRSGRSLALSPSTARLLKLADGCEHKMLLGLVIYATGVTRVLRMLPTSLIAGVTTLLLRLAGTKSTLIN
jgi:hypothetical protein